MPSPKHNIPSRETVAAFHPIVLDDIQAEKLHNLFFSNEKKYLKAYSPLQVKFLPFKTSTVGKH